MISATPFIQQWCHKSIPIFAKIYSLLRNGRLSHENTQFTIFISLDKGMSVLQLIGDLYHNLNLSTRVMGARGGDSPTFIKQRIVDTQTTLLSASCKNEKH